MRKCARGLWTLLAGMMLAAPASAFDTDISLAFGKGGVFIHVEMDDSHDLCFVDQVGDEIEIEVLMFDPAIFPGVPDPSVFTRNQLRILADDREFEDYDLDDFGQIDIFCRGGNDVVLTNMVFKRMFVHGGDGDDMIEGGEVGDTLAGGKGRDHLIGKGGDDYLVDGWLGGRSGDGSRDILEGGAGSDTFDSGLVRRLVRVPQMVIPSAGPFRRLTPPFEWRWLDEDDVRDFNPMQDRWAVAI